MSRLTLEDTAQDASGRKLHAAAKGYFTDPCLQALAHDGTYLNSPLMNRGYWLRVRAVEHTVSQFVNAPFCQRPTATEDEDAAAPHHGQNDPQGHHAQGRGHDGTHPDAKTAHEGGVGSPDPAMLPIQVVSLGAGYDTLFFKWAMAAEAEEKKKSAGKNTGDDEHDEDGAHGDDRPAHRFPVPSHPPLPSRPAGAAVAAEAVPPFYNRAAMGGAHSPLANARHTGTSPSHQHVSGGPGIGAVAGGSPAGDLRFGGAPISAMGGVQGMVGSPRPNVNVAAIPGAIPTTALTPAEAAKKIALNQNVVGGPMAGHGFNNVHRFVELDLPDVVHHKASVIRKSASLRELSQRKSAVDGQPVYRLIGADMGNTDELRAALLGGADHGILTGGVHATPPPSFSTNDQTSTDSAAADHPAESEHREKKGGTAVLDPTLPTLLIAECVMVYMDPGQGTELLRTLITAPILGPQTPVCFFGYDAVNPTSRFGQQMVSTLEDRGVPLRGIQSFPTPASLADRCTSVGFAQAKGVTMKALFLSVPAEVMRALDGIERIDDYDEWCLVHEHYGVVRAQRPALDTGVASLF